jgi:hypothetical protein
MCSKEMIRQVEGWQNRWLQQDQVEGSLSVTNYVFVTAEVH